MEALALFDVDLRPEAHAVAALGDRGRDLARRGAGPAGAPLPAPVAAATLLAVDGNSLAHRGYHAYAAPRVDGDLVGAGLYGFLALLAAVADVTRPDAVVVGFDCRQRSVRRDRWSAYKAQRADKPAALDALLDEAPRVVEALGGTVVCEEGWEADDVLGSASAAAEARGWRCVVATSDRDAYQLVSATTTLLRLRSGMANAVTVTERRIHREVGVAPHQYVEYAALRGDTSDNLPGIPGIGPRRARDLLRCYPTVADAAADPMGCRSVLGRELGQALVDDHANPDGTFHRNVELMTIRRELAVDPEAGRPRSTPALIDAVLRPRRLAGLIARMVQVFGAVADAEDVPPVGDEHAPAR